MYNTSSTIRHMVYDKNLTDKITNKITNNIFDALNIITYILKSFLCHIIQKNNQRWRCLCVSALRLSIPRPLQRDCGGSK